MSAEARLVLPRAADIHARLGKSWPAVLGQLGVGESYLRLKKPGPCPACGGRDRYTFDNRTGHGDFVCRGCGAGDGFELLKRVNGWSFVESLKRVSETLGLETAGRAQARATPAAIARPAKAMPTQRARAVLRGSCAVSDCPDAIAYLESRALWPLPEGCTLRAHPALDYWEEGQCIGHFPGLVAEVRDIADESVTVQVTFLAHGRKLEGHEPRKLLSHLTERDGCAVRLLPAAETLGCAEGLESALSASIMHSIPVWAALTTSLLSRFEPPSEVKRLVIFADRDEPGLLAAARLMERLQGRVRFELRVPSAPAKDFNDVHRDRSHGR